MTLVRSSAQLLGYSQLAIPLAFAGLPLYLHAPAYYANHHQVSLGTLGLIMLGLRLVDAFQDPLIGRYSDRYPGYRSAILMAGLCLLGGGIWLVFHPSGDHPALWFAVSLFLSTTGYSIVSINQQALGSLWGADSRARTRIHSWRESAGLCGILLAASAPTLLGSHHHPEQAFHLYTLFSLPLLLIAGFVFYRWQRHARLPIAQDTGQTGHSFRLLQNNRRFYAFYLANSLASALPAVLVLYYIQDRLQADAYSGYYLSIYFLSGALGMPIWQTLANRYGKYRAWQISILVAAISFIWAYSLGPGDLYAYGLVCLFSGLALGADLALPPAILADRMAQQSDYANATSYHANLALLNKTALALAAGIALPLLALFGYQPGTTDPSATQVLSLTYALLPSGLKLLMAYLLWRHFIQPEIRQ